MKTTLRFLLFCGLSNLLAAQTTVTLDGASGSQTYSLARTTDGGLTLGLAFQVEYLVVGGGGGGGGAGGSNGDYDGGGGGGAGGFLAGSTYLDSGVIAVAVGAGGAGGSTSSIEADRQGKNGSLSSLGDIIAYGGGGGGSGDGLYIGNWGSDGASGGGGGGRSHNLYVSGGAGKAGQGNRGGNFLLSTEGRMVLNLALSMAGGGGGGAGSAGGNGTEDNGIFQNWTRGGNGGDGLASSISGTSITYAGGGGGGAERNGGSESAGSGGSGGGGNGSTGSGNNGGNGTANRGGGGGGAGNDANGGSGGSGIVTVRYKGDSAGSGGAVTTGTGTAAGYTLHTFTTSGSSSLDLSGLNLDTRLGAVENGVISGSGDLTYTGPGKLTLNAANTYSGVTRIHGGSLVIGGNGSIAGSSGVSIANGANFNVSTATGGFTLGAGKTLSGGGTVTGDITIAGTHSPGFSPGIQAFEDDPTYTTGSNVIWELTGNTLDGRGENYDGIDVTGDLTFSGSTTISLDFALAGSTVSWSDAFWSTSKLGTNGWQIFAVDGGISGFDKLSLAGSLLDSGNSSLSSIRNGSSFSLFQAEDGIYLNYNAIPEPGAALLGGLGMLVLLRRRRF